MLCIPQTDFSRLESQLKSFLTSRLKNLKLESMSMVDSRVNLQYQYKQEPTLDWTAFANDLNQATAPATVEIFVG